MHKVLPIQFSELEKFVDQWAKPTFKERYAARMASSMAEIEEFYHAMHPRMDEIVDCFKTYQPRQIPEGLKPLLMLALAFMDTAAPVELFHTPNVPYGLDFWRLEMDEHLTVV